MPTYNGERFIRRQLQTIVTQSRPPDELVISDDGSTDATLAVVRDVVVPRDTAVRVIEGAHQGLRSNVERALTACSGDVIVLADQDDLWRPGKLDAVDRAFEDASVNLWFSDADVMDEAESPFGFRLWEAVSLTAEDLDPREGRALRRLLHGSTVTGATMAFRSSLLAVALPLPAQLEGDDHLYLHDGWIAVLAAALGSIVTDPTPYVVYRQHYAQVTGMSVTKLSNRLDDRARRAPASGSDMTTEHARIRLVMDRLTATGALQLCRSDNRRMLVELEEFLAVRVSPRSGDRTRRALRMLRDGRYRSYARGWRTAAADLLYPRR